MRYAKRVMRLGWFAAAVSIVGLLSAAPAEPVGRAPVDWTALKPGDASPDQLLVRFNPAKAKVAANGKREISAHAALKATVNREFKRVPWQVVSLPKGVSLAAAAARYKADPAVVDVVPNTTYQASALPNDPKYGELWGLPYIGAPAAWEVTTGSPEIIVAVIDTGIRYTHTDLAANMWVNPGESGLDSLGRNKSTNAVDDDGNGIVDDVYGARWVTGTGIPTSGDPMDGAGHGTHVAGTIGAVGNNMVGVVGVNWNVKLMALKFLADSGGGSAADAMSAIEYAIEKGAHLSNNSWGGGGYNQALFEMIDAARQANQLFIAAAGNSATNNDYEPHYPSSYTNDNIIAVASVASDGSMSPFSCFGGTSVDIAAPGSDIHSTWCTSDTAYNTISGTSMATPHVAGAAALLLSLRPGASYDAVRDALLDSATPNPAFTYLSITEGDLNLPGAIERFAGVLELDRLAYRSDATVQVTINDGSYGGDPITASWSTVSAGGVPHASGTFAVNRVPGTTQFVGSFTLATGTLASHGDLLTVSYVDAGAYTVAVQAPIDDIAPVISQIVIDSPDDGELSVQWLTDERAIGGIRVDTVVPPTAYEASHTNFLAGYVTNHVESLTGLPNFTIFYVAIWSEDLAGNRAELPPNPGSTIPTDYLQVATMGGEEIIRYDMERGTSGWTVGNIAGSNCWEYGTPTYGPPIASRCWGTIINGRYPDGANATLTSPTVLVRDNPVISFRHWYDIESTPDDYVQIQDADCGYIEVLAQGQWHNVTAYARPAQPMDRIAGTTSDWSTVRVVLPAAFENQPIQVRFRFLSDTVRLGRGNPAGWYIDNVAFFDQPSDSIGLGAVEIDDAAPGGDADGAAEPGENVRIQLTSFNASGSPVNIREGSFMLLVGGTVSSQVSLTGGSPAVLNYGVLPAGSPVRSGWFNVAVAAGTPPGTAVTVVQTLIDTAGVIHQSRSVFRILNLGPITGTVFSPTTGGDVPIEGATVEAQRSDESFSTTTAADGTFALPQTSSNVTYRLSARRGGAQVATSVVAPTNVILRMPIALLEVAPTNIVLAINVNETIGAEFTISNRVDASAALDYVLSIRYEGEPQVGWLSITNPPSLSGSLAPGASAVHSLAVADGVRPGTYVAYVDIASNDSKPEPDYVTVTLTVGDLLLLDVAPYYVDDSLTGDGDGMFDPGETVELYVGLSNTNATTVATGITADLSVIDPPGGATVDSGNPLSWPNLLPGVSALSLTPATVTWNPPPEQPLVWFRLTGTDGLGRPFQLDFSVTNAPMNSMTGVVTSISALPLRPPGVVAPLWGAVVTAEAVDGTVVSAYTDFDGNYRLDGLVPGDPYWVRLEVPNYWPYVPPAGTNIYATDAILIKDFQAVNYGTNAPVLRLYDVEVDDTETGDGDGAIDPGETLSVQVFVRNYGATSSLLTTGMLQTAVMHVPDCMAVIDGVAESNVTVLAGYIEPLSPPFVVTVDPAAVEGDFQRFWVNAAVANTPTLTWPFDFRLDVAPRYSIAGNVTFTDGNTPAKFADVRLTVTNTLGESAVTTPDASGAYRFDGLRPNLDYGVRVSAVPSGYERPDEQFVFLDSDKYGVNFVIRPWQIGIVPNPINMTVAEGSSTSRVLTVTNGDTLGRDVTFDIRYKRKQVDIIPAPDVVLAGLQQNWPVNWTGLSADDYTGEIEIRFADGTPLAEREAYLRRHNLKAVFHFTLVPAVLARPLVGEGVAALAAIGGPDALAEPGVVAYLQPNQIIRPQALPNDASFDDLWGLRNVRQTSGTLGADIGAEQVWDRTTGDSSVIVAVCDTGVDIEHEDLADNIWINPFEREGDANGDGYPGVAGVDDDGDAARQVTRIDPATGILRYEIPGNNIDDDGDGIIDETGVDFDDEDVMLADYDQDGQVHVVRGWRLNSYAQPEFFETIDEDDRLLATYDDDENGYVDDFHGWNVALWSNDVRDNEGHGTHVAGTIGAVGNNGLGVCGVNWDVSLMVLRLVDDYGYFTSSARLAKAMEYAIRNGARVSNHSWGGPNGSGIMYEVMRSGIQGNHLFAIAAGNSAKDIGVTPFYPAYFSTVLDNVITVAAADHDDRLATFSNFGAESVHLAAPGVDILSTVPAAYDTYSGTSMATPHVAGAAGLLFALSPGTTYDVVKSALLEGVRLDSGLTGWVKTGGHLDLDAAMQVIGADWLRFAGAGLRLTATVPAGTATNLTLLFNNPPELRRGLYEAVIDVSDFFGEGSIPVTLNVTAKAVPQLLEVRVLQDSDADGYPENGESVALWISIRNNGSASLNNVGGTLVPVTAGAAVMPGSNTCSYGYVSGFQNAEPDRAFGVTLPPAGTPVLFNLEIRNGATLVATLPVSIAVAPRHAILGRVVHAANPATGVAGALVEVWGAMGATAVSGADGTFKVQGLLPGDYDLRAIPAGDARSAVLAVAALAADRNIGNVPVASPRVTLGTNAVVVAIQQGMTTNVPIRIAKGSASPADVFAFQTVVAPRRRVALIADGTTLGRLVTPLERMGFVVDRYTNNFAVVHYFDPATLSNQIQQFVRYSWDDALLFRYDFVVADVSGPDGAGRPFQDYEAEAYQRYLNRGGKVLFTGVNPLSRPDNETLAAIFGLGVDAMDRVDGSVGSAALLDPITGPFVPLANGDQLAAYAADYDKATLALLGSARRVAAVGDANKVLRVGYGASGAAYLWTGNPGSGDWQSEGAWLDLLRNILWQDLVLDAPISWINATPVSGTASNTLTLALNADRAALSGTYEATVRVLGRADGEEVLPIQVNLTIAPPTLRVHNASGQVVDWGGRPLPGDGGERSCMLQLLWAGPNGVPNAPAADGSPGGDDVALTATENGLAFGRFGRGYEQTPDRGKFDLTFDHAFTPGTPSIVLFARAWDAASPAAAMAYGDSTVRHTLQFLPDETVDFGSWTVGVVTSAFADTNGDGIPDRWTVDFRPDLDPRAPITNLTQLAKTTNTNRIDSLSAPARLVVSTNFLFVLEQGAHRISVYNRATKALVARYGKSGGSGSTGIGDGEFNFPQGMAADPRDGVFRFAVADTKNNRVQVFTYNPTTGAVTFERKFGSKTSGTPSAAAPDGTFAEPRAVAITPAGGFLVADTGNCRVQWFSSTGVHEGLEGTISLVSGSNNQTVPEGICFDIRDDVDGFWIADSGNNWLAFYALFNTTGIPDEILGTPPGFFDNPTDVQIWTVGSRQRFCVVDQTHQRIRVLDMDGNPLFDFGSELIGSDPLTRPYGVTPVNGTPTIYVADQGNNRVVWYDLLMDADADGMDDIWEDLEGLDSTRNDAMEDPDNDGLPNIGEFRAKTKPLVADTDGDGRGDLYEMINNRDPLTDDAPFYVPPKLLAVAADPTVVVTGGLVTVTATYDRAPTETVTAYFFTDAGVGRGSATMLPDGSGTNFVCTFLTTGSDFGIFDVEIRSLDQDPPIDTLLGNDAFRVTRPLGATVVCTPDPVSQGQAVTITVTFSEPVQDAPVPQVALADGATLAATAMVKLTSSTYRYVYTTLLADLGTVNGTISGAVAEATGEALAPTAFAFVIVPSSIPQVDITAIEFEAPFFLWLRWPAVLAPGAPTQRFEVEYTTSLVPSPAVWTLLDTVDVVAPATEGSYQVNLNALVPSEPTTCFFRIRRIQ